MRVTQGYKISWEYPGTRVILRRPRAENSGRHGGWRCGPSGLNRLVSEPGHLGGEDAGRPGGSGGLGAQPSAAEGLEGPRPSGRDNLRAGAPGRQSAGRLHDGAGGDLPTPGRRPRDRGPRCPAGASATRRARGQVKSTVWVQRDKISTPPLLGVGRCYAPLGISGSIQPDLTSARDQHGCRARSSHRRTHNRPQRPRPSHGLKRKQQQKQTVLLHRRLMCF